MPLPKYLIKKYGVSKKAWAEFRKVKKHAKKLRKHKNKIKSPFGVAHAAAKKRLKTKSKRKRRKNKRPKMARRRRARRRSSPVRRARRRPANRLGLGALGRAALGAGGYVLYETFLSPMIPVAGYAKNAVELAGGLFLSRRPGILGAVGRTAVVINSYQLIKSLMARYAAPGAGAAPANGNGLDIA